jgi:hypothetical protein
LAIPEHLDPHGEHTGKVGKRDHNICIQGTINCKEALPRRKGIRGIYYSLDKMDMHLRPNEDKEVPT